ncbi:TSUP family transporter [Pseudoalteromonas sp. SaAl2]
MFTHVLKIKPWLLPAIFIVIIYSGLLINQGFSELLSNFIAQISIAVTMAAGSFVAGGTALGGGAVAFPVMTKLLVIDPATAKVFSLAIQSFGMSAAAITIIFTGIKFYRNVVLVAAPIAIVGSSISLLFIAEYLPRLVVKGVFSCLLLCFALTLLWRLYHRRQYVCSETAICVDYVSLAVVAFVGGLASGLVGSGADIAIFALLIIACNANIQKATATSVLIMALTSVVSSVINYYFLDVISQQIEAYLLAAIPVVVVGAPLGAYLCAKMKSGQLIAFLLLLIAIEVVFTLYELTHNYSSS